MVTCTELVNLVSVIMQYLVLVSWAQFFKGEILDAIIDNHIIEVIDNMEGIIKTSHSTIIDGDHERDFIVILFTALAIVPKHLNVLYLCEV